MMMYRTERLEKLFSETKPNDSFQQRFLKSIALIKSISPNTALMLIRFTDDPIIVMHSLRSLMITQSPEGVERIVSLLRKGQLLDSDATSLLALEAGFSLNLLSENAPTPEHLRMLSALINRREDKAALVGALPKDVLMALVKAEKDMATVKFYLAQLIRNAEKGGFEQIMSMFQQGTLRGDEVTELLGNNPRFSYDLLADAPPQHAYQIQLTELERKYPAATGVVIPGMYVLTPGGWGLIESIHDAQGNKLVSAHAEERVIYILRLHPFTTPEPATLDMNKRELIFPGTKSVLRCSKCGSFITSSDRLLKEHYHLTHQDINLSFSSISPHIAVTIDPEFKEKIQ
jgi:DNA-binding ferritin-like protein (Dps family)